MEKYRKNYRLVKYLNADVNNFTSDIGIKIRRKVNNVFRYVLRKSLKEKIIIDNYPKLNKNEPYIFVSTHGFTDDIAACLATIDRSTYLLFGSTNQIEYNKMAYAAWANGFIYVNRLDNKSRKDSLLKMKRVLKNGSSVLIFPEGGHNNSENSLCNKLFAGPYILAKETGIKVVPIAPFYEYGSDKIYMNVGNPIDLAKYDDKKEALEDLRDTFATMVYENIEKHSTPFVRDGSDYHLAFMEQRRKEYLKNHWTRDTWDEELTVYLDKDDKEYLSVLDSFDEIQNNADAYIPGSLSEAKVLRKKYDFKDYMHKNWNK